MFTGKKRLATDQWGFVVRTNQTEGLSFEFRGQQVRSGAVCSVVVSSIRSSVWYHRQICYLEGLDNLYVFVLGEAIFHDDISMTRVQPEMYRVASDSAINVLCNDAICEKFSKQYNHDYI